MRGGVPKKFSNRAANYHIFLIYFRGGQLFFGSMIRLEIKLVYANQCKYHMDLFDLTFRKKALSRPFSRKTFLEASLMFYQQKNVPESRVVRGPNVA